MTSDDYFKDVMLRNAAQIERLHSRVHETFRQRDKSQESWAQWKQAAAEFHSRYDALAFPGGYAGALERIASGDPHTMEAAINFLECRPYFFRSGYMFQAILRRCKRAPLPKELADRLQIVIAKRLEWRSRKSSS